jgi:hypothetical protein
MCEEVVADVFLVVSMPGFYQHLRASGQVRWNKQKTIIAKDYIRISNLA